MSKREYVELPPFVTSKRGLDDVGGFLNKFQGQQNRGYTKFHRDEDLTDADYGIYPDEDRVEELDESFGVDDPRHPFYAAERNLGTPYFAPPGFDETDRTRLLIENYKSPVSTASKYSLLIE